ncbi:MAG: hypothetical protein JO332_01890 [Planctomycetaceae bacterium]|nr:hypothetical protein [Planctomycetaceae bacterium]
MDQPEEVVCFACGARLGLSTDPRSQWNCACGKQLRATAQGTREVTPEYRSIVRQLEDLERRFVEESEGFSMIVGASRGSPGHSAPPDLAAGRLAAASMLVIFGGFGITLLAHRAFGVGVCLLLAGIVSFVWMLRNSQQRVEGYRILKADYDARRRDLEDRLSRS